jgi:phospholipid/cholesterol/gamma-HCH transport system permease protein
MAVPLRLRTAATRSATNVLDGVGGFGSWIYFCGRAFVHVPMALVRFRKEIRRQISDIAVGAGAYVVGGGMVFVIAAMSLFVGGTVGIQAFQGLSSIGAESFTGLVGAYANTREITPVIAGIALASQVGSSFTAEIGAMRIADEIDALDVMAVPSLPYLVSTRLIAIVLALIPLYMVALITSFWATKLVTTQFMGLSPGIYDYYFQLYLPPIDVLFSLIKVVVFAMLIALIHTYYGYYATDGPAGVGRAVGKALRATIVWLVAVNLLLSYVFWGNRTTVSLTG